MTVAHRRAVGARRRINSRTTLQLFWPIRVPTLCNDADPTLSFRIFNGLSGLIDPEGENWSVGVSVALPLCIPSCYIHD